MSKVPEKLLFTAKDHRYINETTTQRKVRLKDNHGYSEHYEIASRIYTTKEATFDIEVDVPAIVDLVLRRARTNKSGKAVLLDGLAIAKRRGKAKELSTTVDEQPLRDSYELVP